MKHPLLLAWLIPCVLLLGQTQGICGRQMRVATVSVTTRYPVPGPDKYLPLVPFKEGDLITEASIEKAERLLMGTGLFSSVAISPRGPEEATELLVRLDQIERIRRIEIRGNFPVLTSSIARTLELGRSDPFDPEKIPQEERRIVEVFEKKGWYGTRVETTYTIDPQDGTASIVYQVLRGVRAKLEGLDLEGVVHGDAARVRSLLEPLWWVSGRGLDKGLERVRRYYRDIGYPTAQVEIEKVDLDLARKRARVHVRVHEGRRFEITITGNTHFSASRLLEVARAGQEQGLPPPPGQVDIEDTARIIRGFYEKKGYALARVAASRTDVGTERTAVDLAIEEGPKVSVRGIVVVGNASIPTRLIKRHLHTRKKNLLLFRRGRLVSRDLEEDLDTIRELYARKGFLDVEVTVERHQFKRTQGGVVLVFRIEEGPRYVIGSAKVVGAASLSEKALSFLVRLPPGTAYNEMLVSEAAGRIAKLYKQRGYLDCRVTSSSAVGPDHKVDVIFTVTEGPLYTSRGVVPSGNLSTRPGTIIEAADLPAGARLGPQVLERSRKRLRQLGIFDSIFVKPVPMLLADDAAPEEAPGRTAAVVVSVRERKRLATEIGGRYDTDLGAEAFASLSHENLLGRAKKARLHLLLGQKESEASLSLTDPMLLGYGVIGTLTSGYKREVLEAYRKETTSIEASVYRTFWDEKLTPSLVLSLERAVTFDVSGTDPEAPSAETTHSIFAGPRLVLNFTDDIFYPTRGWYGAAGAQASSKAWGSDANLVRYNLQGKWYARLAPGWVLATNLALDAVEPFGTTTRVPSPNLFFAGGSTTVRGFPKDSLGPLDDQGRPLGGSTRILANVEVRFPIYGIIHGVVFMDAGSLSNGFGGVDPRLSAGGGLRLYTPVGPLRAEYGYQLRRNPPLDRGQFLFSLGFPF